jgi:tRNA threonylcarbamoyladenosine biosynthesis protein TsaB
MPEGGPLLAWETSTEDGVVCLGSAGDVIASARFRTVKGHAGWLMPLVDSTLKGVGVDARDLGAIAAGIGPGGFTGVKVGVATAKAMAYALEVPLVGVPTLDLMAAHAPKASDPVLACIDARQGLLYAAGYDVSGLFPRRLTEQACVSPAEAARLAASFSSVRLTLAGFVPTELQQECRRLGLSAQVAAIDAPGFPSAATLLATASGMLERGEAGNAFSVVPVYLKKPV